MHIKEMLAKAKSDGVISPIEARDAMLGCFVTIHGLALQRGAELMGKDLDDAGVERHAIVIMKGLLGADWEQPSTPAWIATQASSDSDGLKPEKSRSDLTERHYRISVRYFGNRLVQAFFRRTKKASMLRPPSSIA
jgi:hypothetical protein